MIKNHFISGDHNLICDVCSVKTKASKTRTRWDGFQVCPSCYEERQPQDFVKAKTDKITVPITRPIPTLLFTSVVYADTDNTTIPSGNNINTL